MKSIGIILSIGILWAAAGCASNPQASQAWGRFFQGMSNSARSQQAQYDAEYNAMFPAFGTPQYYQMQRDKAELRYYQGLGY